MHTHFDTSAPDILKNNVATRELVHYEQFIQYPQRVQHFFDNLTIIYRDVSTFSAIC